MFSPHSVPDSTAAPLHPGYGYCSIAFARANPFALRHFPYPPTPSLCFPQPLLVSLPMRQPVHIGRQQIPLALAAELAPCGHVAAASLGDGFDHGTFAAAIEPDVVGEIRCAHRLVALAVRSVTRGAVGRENFFALHRSQ